MGLFLFDGLLPKEVCQTDDENRNYSILLLSIYHVAKQDYDIAISVRFIRKQSGWLLHKFQQGRP